MIFLRQDVPLSLSRSILGLVGWVFFGGRFWFCELEECFLPLSSCSSTTNNPNALLLPIPFTTAFPHHPIFTNIKVEIRKANRRNSGSGDRSADASTSLAGIEAGLLALNDLGAFLHHFLAFGQDELDVAWVRHVGVDLLYLERLGCND